MKQAKHIHGDDTNTPTLSLGKRRTQTGRYWTYVCDGRPWNEEAAPAVWLQYSENRKRVYPTAHFKCFNVSMQAVAYAGYNDVYRKDVKLVACWAHARSKFIEVSEPGPSPIADKAIAFIQFLYAIEKIIKDEPPDNRQQIRKQHNPGLYLSSTIGCRQPCVLCHKAKKHVTGERLQFN